MKPRASRTRLLLGLLDAERLERVVILSPHLDDAVLSCGGLLDALQGSVPRLTVTLHCGNTDAPRRRHIPPAVRRREDRRAMSDIGCDYVHLGFQDCVYRRSPTSGKLIYREPRQGFAMPNVDDAAHAEELFLVLRRLCSNMGAIALFSPMGIGRHVDHIICAYTACRLVGKGVRLLFYEDFPYVCDPRIGHGVEEGPAEALGRFGLAPAERFAVPFDASRKEQLIGHYTTQLEPLFGAGQGLNALLHKRRYRGAPAEFFWRARPIAESVVDHEQERA
ncbi:MAG: PIG-L family deacetylase [Myxococcales bacterium]|nr:PIG-L family deacetylase [Myxococcales bacterium]